MKNIIVLIALIVMTHSTKAQVFEPPVIIDPPNPMVGDTIRVGLFTTFYPPCLILPQQNQQGDTHLFEQSNNHIDLTVISINTPLCNPFPVSPAPREYYELGQLQEGQYTLQTSWVSFLIPLPVPPNITPSQYGQQITFSVTAPKVVNSSSKASLFLLIISIIFLTLFILKIKNRNKCLGSFL